MLLYLKQSQDFRNKSRPRKDKVSLDNSAKEEKCPSAKVPLCDLGLNFDRGSISISQKGGQEERPGGYQGSEAAY